MYSDGEGLGTPAGKSAPNKAWSNRINARKKHSSGKRVVRCICPRCRKTIKVFMLWTGRGVPRKYCADCKAVINTYEESVVYDECHSGAAPSRKLGHGVIEE